MKKLILAMAMVLAMAGSVFGGAFETITVADTSIGITSSLLTPAYSQQPNYAICTLATAEIRFRVDGTAPTSAVGHILSIGTPLYLNSQEELYGFKAIRTGGTSGVLSCTVTWRQGN